MSKPKQIAALWWRTLEPLPLGTHAFRAVNVARQRLWGPLLPGLVAWWRQRGRDLAGQVRREPLLALGAALAAAPAPDAGDLLEGRFVVVGKAIEAFPPSDWRLPDARPLEVYEAHYMQWADTLVAAALSAEADGWRAARALALLEAGLDGWTRASLTLPKAWEPYPRARRALACLQAAARLTALEHHGRDRLEGTHSALRQRLLETAAAAVTDLDLLTERHLGGNHLLVDRIALAAGEAVWGSGRAASEAAADELETQFPGDGGHVEASPMYHAQLLEDVLVLQALLSTTADGPLGRIRTRANRATAWLAAMRHPDGQLPAFGDSDPGVLSSLRLTRTALRRTTPLTPNPLQSAWVSRHGGHFAVVHTAPPAWDPQPGHAHADHLSVEWSCADRRFLSDAGLAGYDGDPNRALNRSAASHSTVEVPGAPSIELWATFRVGARGKVHSVQSGREDGWDWLTAVHTWPDAGLHHLRLVAHHPRGRLLVVDGLLSEAATPQGLGRLLLAPGVVWGPDDTLEHAGDFVRFQATETLQRDTGWRFDDRSQPKLGEELRYPVGGREGTWVLLSADAADFAAVRLLFGRRWQTLAAAPRVG